MEKNDRLEVIVAVVAFAAFLFTPLHPAGDDTVPRIISESPRPWLMSFVGIIGLPLCYAVPSLRASSMGKYWKVPSTAYIFPRWYLRVACGMLVGQTAALLTLALTRDQRLFWLLPFQLCAAGGFCFGTWRRLRKPASNEFTLPWWPRFR